MVELRVVWLNEARARFFVSVNYFQFHPTSHVYYLPELLKPQYSFGEFNNFFLIFRKCRKSSENTIGPSCNCFELHSVMQYCPVANYLYVHNLWQSVRGGLRTFLCFGNFLKMETFWSELLKGINSSYNSIGFCINNIYIHVYKFSFGLVPKLSIGFNQIPLHLIFCIGALNYFQGIGNGYRISPFSRPTL